MKDNVKSIFLLTPIFVLSLTSCSEEKDLYDPALQEQMQKSTFAANFEARYGKVAADQWWDFATPQSRYAATRVEDIASVVSEEYYDVEQSTIDYFKGNLAEGENNRSKGATFLMTAPNNGFEIIPIYQGAASMLWDLHMVIEVGGREISDVKVWEKHQNILCLLDDATLDYDVTPQHLLSEYTGKNFFDEFGYSRDGETWYPTNQCFSLHDSYSEYLNGAGWAPDSPGRNGWWENYECGWNTMNAKAIRSKAVRFDGLPVGATIYFYLAVWNSADDKTGGQEPKSQESSLNKMMVYLEDCPLPTNITPSANGQKKEIMIIGCEDNSAPDSDWDMNDLIFMVVGDPVAPKPLEVKENKYEEIVVSKRYMIEDLGSTDDFDFNDIVVDLEQYRTRTIVLTNGVKTDDVAGEMCERLIIRHLGGTLPWELFVGEESVTGVRQGCMDADGYTRNEVIEMKAGTWNPTMNNITVKVARSGTSTEVYTIPFPAVGTVPMIIAFDTTEQWMNERVNILPVWQSKQQQ